LVLHLERPLALAHDGLARAVLLDAVDVHLVRADHEVDVRQADVAAALHELLVADVLRAVQVDAVGASQRQVTGGVLVDQRVVEEMSTLGDGRRERHQRHLAEVGCAFVGLDQLLERGLALPRADPGHAALLEGQAEVLQQGAAVAERDRGAHHAVHLVAVGQGEDLLGRQVGDELDAVLGMLAGADPPVTARQADGQVGAWGLVVQGAVLLGGQIIGVLEQGLDVLLPGRHGVGTVGAGDLEDGAPQFVVGLVARQVGEDLDGPVGRGGGHHQPVDSVARHAQADRGELFEVGLLHRADPLGVQVAQQVGVVRADGQHGVALFDHVHQRADVRIGVLAEAAFGRVLHTGADQLLVVPQHVHVAGARLIGLACHRAHQRGGMQRHPARGGVVDDQALTLAQVQAHVDDQLGVLVQEFVKRGHGVSF